ncbi:Inosose dehydratase [subsurface metagenome]
MSLTKRRIALQLYSVRGECAKDLPSTLQEVAEMGYDGVEFAGYYGRSARDLRTMLEDLGLEVAGTHVGIETLQGDRLGDSIEFNRVLGNQFLVVPSLPVEMTSSRGSWLRAAHRLNEIADQLRPEGMQVGFHNHVIEFQPIEGELPWDIIFGTTKRDVVMQFDTGNAMAGGVSPKQMLEIFERYPQRATTVHLKEYSSKKGGALIGEGEVEWKEFFAICESMGGTEWYIVEQEQYPMGPLECARRSKENLDKILM